MNDIYHTRDIGLAATLITLRFKMIGVSYQYEGVRSLPVGYFEFQESENLQKAIQSFWRGELAIEPRAFMGNMRGLKAQISNIYKNPYNQPQSKDATNTGKPQ